MPDTFKANAEVVAKGMLTADNKLDVVPDGIMAKCPTKYKPEEGAAAAGKPIVDPGPIDKI